MKREAHNTVSKRGRFVSVVIAGSVAFWVLANLVGAQLGLAGRYAILLDMMVAAALLWSLIVLFQIWRDQRQGED